MNLLTHSLILAQRHLRNLSRQPWWIVISLVQPIVWLLLYGQLFKRIVELPGFNAASYITFVTPGVVIMSALFAGGWNGMGVIMDMNMGVMDRLLVSPVNRAAIIAGRILSMAAVSGLQSLILIGLGFLTGARFAGGILGVDLVAALAPMADASGYGAVLALLIGYIPLLGIGLAFYYLNRWRPDVGISYAWVGRAGETLGGLADVGLAPQATQLHGVHGQALAHLGPHLPHGIARLRRPPHEGRHDRGHDPAGCEGPGVGQHAEPPRRKIGRAHV